MTITGGRLIRAMLDDEDGHSESTNVKDDWNERILELAEQADIEWLLEHHPKIEKFAKLIVRECYQHCKDQLMDKKLAEEAGLDYNDGVMDCAIGLKQHFGVEL